jgi:hypothetical protein
MDGETNVRCGARGRDWAARLTRQIRFCSQAAILGVPFRAGPAHIVQVGPIGAFAAEASPPQPTQGLGKIVTHGTLQTLPTPKGGAAAVALKHMYYFQTDV